MSIWHKILKDSQSSINVNRDTNVLVLGDERNGRKSVIRKLIGRDVGEVKHENSVLEYTFMRVNSDDYGESKYRASVSCHLFSSN